MPPDANAEILIVDAGEASRFEARIGEALAGSLQYRVGHGRIVLIHTEVDAGFEGRGVGRRLAAWALDSARTRELKVIVGCPFVAEYVRRHPEYRDLVVAGV